MYMSDFSFGEDRLSDFKYMVAYANTSPSESSSMGSIMNLNTVNNLTNHANKLVTVGYDEVITATFDIIKNPCYFREEDLVVTRNDISNIMRWLSSNRYKKFAPIYTINKDGEIDSSVYYTGTFTNIDTINVGDNIMGFTLTFTSNSPFGYGKENEISNTISSDTKTTIQYFNDTDEYGYLYPEYFIFKPSRAGEYIIRNLNDSGSVTMITVDSATAVTMDCINKVITGDVSNFNYVFPRFKYDGGERMNTLRVEGTAEAFSADVTFKCSPIRKVGIIV